MTFNRRRFASAVFLCAGHDLPS